MTRKFAIDSFVRNEQDTQLVKMADELANRFRERAAKHDVEGTFPFENFAELKNSGAVALTVPKSLGGEEISLYQMLLFLERIGRGDGSTALAFGWHLGIMLNLRTTREWPESLYTQFCREVVEKGAMINKFDSEPATGSPSRGGKPETVAVRTEKGWQITGRKTFSTLSPILEHFIVTASIDGEERVGQFFVRKQEGVRIEETWDTIGMRATGSHDLILDHVEVGDEDVIKIVNAKDRHMLNKDNGWLLHIPACYLGIAYAARDYALEYAKTYQPNSLSSPISELYHIQDKIGRMEAKLRTARTLLYSVADRWDREEWGRSALKPDLGLVKYVATNTAIAVVDLAMRIVGGASLYRSRPLERLYRDVRAGLHNPPMEDAVLRDLAKDAFKEIGE